MKARKTIISFLIFAVIFASGTFVLLIHLESPLALAQPVIEKRAESKSRMVIVSHLGELLQDTRYIGETVRYKIYYMNDSRQKADIGIFVKPEDRLIQIKVFNRGRYEEGTQTIVWEIRQVAPKQGGFVEFEGVIDEGVRGLRRLALVHTAFIKIQRRTEVETNEVVNHVCDRPPVGWIPFDRVSKPGGPISYMKDETTIGTTVNFDLPGMLVHEVQVQGMLYHRLSIPGHSTLLNLGKPDLPIVGQIIEVPWGVNFKIEIVKSRSISLRCYNVFPAQEREIRQPRRGERKFALDKVAYAMDAYYPQELAAIKAEDIGVIRGHRVVLLKVNPIQFNPVTREIKAFSQVEVRLDYDRPAQIRRVDRRIESPPFERLLKPLVLNYKDPLRFDPGQPRETKKDGCDYLIITHGNFYNPNDPNNPIVRLQDWKRRKGLKTRVVDVANIPGGSTANDIRNYILDSYQNWDPVPTYVLLVGDAEFIPTNYQTAHPEHNNTNIGTDLYYVTVDGSDYFPDMFIGRLSVDTLAQAGDVVDKILAYEQNPPANANYYTNTSMVALFEDDTDRPNDPCPQDGQEDCSFRVVEFAEEIRAYLQNNGYTVNRIYDQSGAFAQGPQRYENGSAIPVDLTLGGNPAAGVPGFPWNGGTADIRTAINNGNFLVTYDGHGNRTSWDRPGFNTNDINALTNGALTPVVFSLACMTCWFDNETDAADIDPAPGVQGTGAGDESFCEHFLRLSNAGAVAIFGSTRISWDNNDFMMLGLYKAIWPDFNPNPPFGPGQLPSIQTGPLISMGQITAFSKMYMANYYNHDFYRQSSFEMYTLFGDPEMALWTAEPARLKLDHPKGIGSTGEQDFVVKATNDASGDPVPNAVVVLTQSNAIVSRGQTNPAGLARFTLNAPASGNLDITVTARNYRPYTGKIEVSSGGANLNRLEPGDGVENQVVHVGGQNFSGSENVDIQFGGQPILTKAASSGSFGQSGVEDVDIQVPSPYALGPVNVLARGQNSGRYAVDVFRVRSANPIDLYTYSQWDSTTWHLHPGGNPVWNNPEIQLYDSGNNPVGSNNLVVGNTYTIKAKVHNDTAFDAKSVKVTFKWSNFGLGQPDNVWTPIGGQDIDVPASSVREAEVKWAPPSTGHLCLLVEIYHIEDINGNNNVGQENCHVGPTTSPAKVPFLVWNPTDKPVAVYLELRQLIPPGQEVKTRLWGSWITHPDPQVIPPGGRREAWAILDPDLADIKSGEAEFALTGFINGRVIGGVNFIIRK
jgi:hypothetical protein